MSSQLSTVSFNVGNGRASSQLSGSLVLASSFHVQDAWVGLVWFSSLLQCCSSEWQWEENTSSREPSWGAANTCSRKLSWDAVNSCFREPSWESLYCKCPLLIIFPLPSRSQEGVLEMWKPLPLRTLRCEPAVDITPTLLPPVLDPA